MGAIDASGAYVHKVSAQHDVTTLLRFFAQQLVAGGYHLTARGETWINAARGLCGSAQGALGQAHTIAVGCDGWNVRVEIRGQFGFGFLFLPHIDAAVNQVFSAFNSYMVQQSMMGPSSSPHGYPPPSSVHVVEKQVVVVRCKFCQAHTPLDAGACRACGAAKFT